MDSAPHIAAHRHSRKSDGDYPISLGEPHADACYKLIAAIIQRDTGTAA